jgi:hypothetical protein
MNANPPIWLNIPKYKPEPKPDCVPKLGCVLSPIPAAININQPNMLRPAYTYPKFLQIPDLS